MVRSYFTDLVEEFGRGWNRFWYTPSDPFTLSVLRVLTGLTALYLHATFTPDLVAFFGDGGLLPTELVSQLRGNEGLTGIHQLSYLSHLSTPTELMTAHAIGAVVLVLFTVGFYTRITSILALIVTLSYIHRAPMVTSEIEPILVMLQFYLCLGPCGAYLSLDRWRSQRPNPEAAVEVSKSWGTTVSLRLIQVHTCVIYLMMGLAKMAGPGILTDVQEWVDPWGGGEAVWWLIARPESRMIDLTWLASHPYLINAWTHAIVLFELCFAVLIWHRTARPLLLIIGVVVWGLFSMISGVAVLSVLMLVANIAFLSPCFLRAVLRRPLP